MHRKKERLTVTVDQAFVRAAHRAVAMGHAASLSSWVNLALSERAAKERRLAAMAEAIVAYEALHGEISAEEIAAQQRADLRGATVTSPRRRKRSGGRAA